MLIVAGTRRDAAQGAAVQADDEATALQALLAAEGDTLVAVTPEEVTRAVRMVRAVMNRRNVALVRLDGTPTQRDIQLYVLTLLKPPQFGVARDLLARVKDITRTRLALSSVAKLKSPAPSIWQHLRSWLPGPGFEVDFSPGAVRRAEGNAWHLDPAHFCVVHSSRAQEKLAVKLAGQPTVHCALDSSPVWQAKEFIEVSMLPADIVQVVRYMLQNIPQQWCYSCKRLQGSEGCLFCGTHVSEHCEIVKQLGEF